MDIATLLKSKRSKLHAKIHDFEHGIQNNKGFHRMTPLKSPTAIITGASDNCAGRNSIDRYCLATGLKATKLDKGSGKVNFCFHPVDGEVILKYESKVSLEIKLPGIKQPLAVQIAVFDDEERRDYPIKFNQNIEFGGGSALAAKMNASGILDANGAMIFPLLKVPKCPTAFDLYPFPSNG